MFSMKLSIWGALKFADYEYGGGGGSGTYSNFGCVINNTFFNLSLNY